MGDTTGTVASLYAALGRNDINTVMSLLDDNVDWRANVPENDFLGGHYRGKAAAATYLQKLLDNCEIKSLNLTEFVSQGDKVVALGHQKEKSKKTGKECEYDFSHVYNVAGGKIKVARLFWDSATYVQAHH